MNPPWRLGPPLENGAFEEVRRRAIFEYCKWDPQVEDACSLAPFAVVLSREDWTLLTSLAEALAREVLGAERELGLSPRLHARLGLPRAARRALRRETPGGHVPGTSRVMRFDFHFTSEGWRISEANTDVPGGFNEAAGLAHLLVSHCPGTCSPGDPAAAYADAIVGTIGSGASAALVHATAYTDDRQVMEFLARAFERRGLRPRLVGPADLRWESGRAFFACEWARGEADVIVRFFPAEWLPNLPRSSGWEHFFGPAVTPVSNPATALLTQSKRFPLVWEDLQSELPTWRALLPETRDPREADWKRDDGWVLKPALGRVGEDVAIRGVIGDRQWRQIARWVEKRPRSWVAQRRFRSLPISAPGGDLFACIGVFAVEGRAAGAYGRVAGRPLIDGQAQDAAVLIEAPDETARAREEGGR